MTEPVRTREAVAREVRRISQKRSWITPDEIAAALLVMAECEHSRLLSLSAAYKLPEDCPFCHGTGLDQSRVARGLNALEGR